MRRATTSVSQEDYLKAIWEIVQEEQIPIAARLAEDLGVTPPAVTSALKRMTRLGYLHVRRDGRIELTAKGEQAAEHLVLRHRLTEKLLTDVIGLEWSLAHEEAEKLEHGMSPEVVDLLVQRFGRESRCPHGVPLVGGMSQLRKKFGAVRLSDAHAKGTFEVLRVYEKDPQFLQFLSNLHLRPGARFRVHSKEYDETLALSVISGGGSGRPRAAVHLGKPATSRIWVRPVS
jgi:DtxR family transcriptional regulator, Mn-dependent transcriptional regulator